MVKLQVTGPVTLAYALGERLRRCAHELATWLAANAGAQVRALAERGHDALLLVDEPALHLFGPGATRCGTRCGRARPRGACICAGPCRGTTVRQAEPDVLSFDLALAPVQADALQALLARGTRVMWGAVQPHRPSTRCTRWRALDAALAATGAAGEQSLLSASCGSGRMSVRREREIATALWDCAHTLRARRPTAEAA